MSTETTFHVGDAVRVVSRLAPAGTDHHTRWLVEAVSPGFDGFGASLDLVLPYTDPDDDGALVFTVSASRCDLWEDPR